MVATFPTNFATGIYRFSYMSGGKRFGFGRNDRKLIRLGLQLIDKGMPVSAVAGKILEEICVDKIVATDGMGGVWFLEPHEVGDDVLAGIVKDTKWNF